MFNKSLRIGLLGICALIILSASGAYAAGGTHRITPTSPAQNLNPATNTHRLQSTNSCPCEPMNRVEPRARRGNIISPLGPTNTTATCP